MHIDILALLQWHFLVCVKILTFLMQVVLGTLLAALVPVVGFNAVMTSEHFASFLVSISQLYFLINLIVSCYFYMPDNIVFCCRFLLLYMWSLLCTISKGFSLQKCSKWLLRLFYPLACMFHLFCFLTVLRVSHIEHTIDLYASHVTYFSG